MYQYRLNTCKTKGGWGIEGTVTSEAEGRKNIQQVGWDKFFSSQEDAKKWIRDFLLSKGTPDKNINIRE